MKMSKRKLYNLLRESVLSEVPKNREDNKKFSDYKEVDPGKKALNESYRRRIKSLTRAQIRNIVESTLFRGY